MAGQGSAQGPHGAAGHSTEESIRAIRIVWFGLLMGLVLYGVVIMVIGGPLWKGPGPSPLETPLSVVMGVLTLGAVIGQFVVRRAFFAEVAGRAEELRQEADPLVPVGALYRGFLIKNYGLVEGTALFALVSYLVTGVPVALAVIAGAILWFLLNFPTEDRARQLVRSAIESA